MDKDKVSSIMPLRQGRGIAFIDISMPRNIDPQVSGIKGVHLRSIDDLDQVVNANMQKRQDALPQVNAIIQQKISEFDEKLRKLKTHNGSDHFEHSISL